MDLLKEADVAIWCAEVASMPFCLKCQGRDGLSLLGKAFGARSARESGRELKRELFGWMAEVRPGW